MPKYLEVRDKMQTGDLLCFSGLGRVSSVIKWATKSLFSHVGLVFRMNDEALGPVVMVVESTSMPFLKDAVTKKMRVGVQLHLLSRRLETTLGEVRWVQIPEELRERLNSKSDGFLRMVLWLRQAHAEEIPYDFKQAVGAGLDTFDWTGFENEPDFSALFCSEMVATAYKLWGLFPEGYNMSEATPENVFQDLWKHLTHEGFVFRNQVIKG